MSDKTAPSAPPARPDEAPNPLTAFRPAADNAEQDDEPAQAQSVAEDVLHGDSLGLGDTIKGPGGEGDDVQDLVDHMRQMDSSGVIDFGAFAGERNDDEEEGRYGPGAEDD